MDLQNKTKNQHFISQVEQRFNALNPDAQEKNQKIYVFSLMDRKSNVLKLKSQNGSKIAATLKLDDVFSFNILNDGIRHNLENLFHHYESNTKRISTDLLSKLSTPNADIGSELLDIFIIKFLNCLRNPHSIQEAKKMFSLFENYYPTNPLLLSIFLQIKEGKKPHWKYLCDQLNITEKEYSDWLATIFMLLSPSQENKKNLFEQVVSELFQNPETSISVHIYTFDKNTCLLSDRGFSMSGSNIGHLTWDFNLTKHCFIRYAFININSLPNNVSQESIDLFKSSRRAHSVNHYLNDLPSLAQYNQNVTHQCYEHVFCSSKECYGVHVEQS